MTTFLAHRSPWFNIANERITHRLPLFTCVLNQYQNLKLIIQSYIIRRHCRRLVDGSSTTAHRTRTRACGTTKHAFDRYYSTGPTSCGRGKAVLEVLNSGASHHTCHEPPISQAWRLGRPRTKGTSLRRRPCQHPPRHLAALSPRHPDDPGGQSRRHHYRPLHRQGNRSRRWSEALKDQ